MREPALHPQPLRGHTLHEQAKFWHAPEFDHLELLRATYITHTFARHIHETYAIGIIEDGLEGFYYRRENHVAGKGRIVLINPGEIHTGHAACTDGWWRYRMFYPGAALMQQIAGELTGSTAPLPFFPAPVVQDDETAALLRQAHVTLETSGSSLERSVMLRLAFGQLIGRYADTQPRSEPLAEQHGSVRAARDYLEAHYQEHVTLDVLAGVAGLSPFHLSRVFQKQTGLPPHAYLTHIRIRHARQLLQTGLPLVEVALAAGFADQSHFTRSFRRVIGVTPGQYIAHR